MYKEKDFIRSNKDCVNGRLSTARDFSGFRKTCQSFMNPKEGSKNMKIWLPDSQFSYGKQDKYLNLDLENKIQLSLFWPTNMDKWISSTDIQTTRMKLYPNSMMNKRDYLSTKLKITS